MENVSDFCVIGSGPSAVSAAMALTRRNLWVTMLDAGRSLESPRMEIVRRMSQSRPAEWRAEDLRSIREGVEVTGGIPLRRAYGSGFSFDTTGVGSVLSQRNAGIRPSFALGGLSNVWGAGMLPFHRDDLEDWPRDASDLGPHYKSVLSFVPLAGERDALESLFPLFTADPGRFTPTQQGRGFLTDAAKYANDLARAGITVGQSRLAVNTNECERCGLCLYGCPYGLIWNSPSVVDRLRSLPNFRYETGFIVDRLREENNRVRIEGHDPATGAARSFEAERVLLGAGAISSTSILLASLGEYGVPINLADSFYFLLPLLRFSGVPDPDREQLHTLAQAFIVMRDPEVSPHFVHFSIYGFNDLMIPAMRATAGPLGGMKSLVSRTLIAGGYLHSSLSPRISMTIEPGRVILEGESSARAAAIARKAAAALFRQAGRLRAMPLPFAMRLPEPGRGFHTGASFPMRSERTPHTSDIEGRPFGFDRVHLIDASCLPTIPATTVTLPVMANAWRIANRAADRA